jgi:hypothetical protein
VQQSFITQIYTQRWLPLGVLLLLMVILTSCSDSEKPEIRKPAADSTKSSDTVLSHNLPTGRFQLPTRITPAPNLWITLPAGYTVKEAGKMPNDRFYILRDDDPSLTDSTAVTPGFMVVVVGISGRSGSDSVKTFTRKEVILGNYPTEWRMWTEGLPKGGSFYVREIVSRDYFARLSPELARAPLNLVIHIAGTDTARVSELMRSVETISIVP